jgi:hypothetical protein
MGRLVSTLAPFECLCRTLGRLLWFLGWRSIRNLGQKNCVPPGLLEFENTIAVPLRGLGHTDGVNWSHLHF